MKALQHHVHQALDVFSCANIWQACEMTGKMQCVVLVWGMHYSRCSSNARLEVSILF